MSVEKNELGELGAEVRHIPGSRLLSALCKAFSASAGMVLGWDDESGEELI